MNTTQMLQAFDLGVDKWSAPSFRQEEKLLFLNKAQYRFVEDNYIGENKQGYSYDETEKIRKDLSELINPYETRTFTTGFFPNSKYVSLGTDTWFVLTEYAILQFAESVICYSASTLTFDGETFTNSRIVPIKVIRDNDYNILINDPYNKPDRSEIFRLDSKDNKHMLIGTEDYSIVGYANRYLKKPSEISVGNDCELHERTHQKIVDISVSIALESVMDPRYKTMQNELLENE